MENLQGFETYIPMSTIKYYTMLALDFVLLFIPWLEDMDMVIKTVSLVLAVIIGIYTIKKIRADLKIKDIETKIREEELKRLRDDS
jgi:hypothetical protein